MIISAINNNTTFNGLGNKVTARYNANMRNISRKILKSANEKNLRGERRDIFIKTEYNKEIEKLKERQRISAGNASTLFD